MHIILLENLIQLCNSFQTEVIRLMVDRIVCEKLLNDIQDNLDAIASIE